MKFIKTFKNLLICLLLVLGIGVGSASWLFNQINQTTNMVTVNKDTLCTVSIHTRTQSSVVNTNTTYNPGPTADNWTVVEKYTTEITNDSGNIVTHGQKQAVGNVVTDPHQTSNENVTLEDGSIQNTIVYERETVYEIGDERTSFGYKRWWHKKQLERRTEIITISREAPVDSTSDKTITVKSGSVISPFDLEIPNYTQYGFYTDQTYTKFFDFSTPITTDTSIYLKYVQTDTDLADRINGLSNSTLNVYDTFRGGSDGNYNAFDDPGYDDITKTVFLEQATINSGSTVNFTYENNLIYLTPITGAVQSDDLEKHRNAADASIAVDYQGNTYIGDRNCYLRVKLLGDLTIRGNVVLGAKIGAHSYNDYYSMIIGGYTEIDLNGHNIIVDGGTFSAYGVVKDTIGTGEVLVTNGGSLIGTLTIGDGRGRDQTPFGYGKGQTPFSEYKFPYITAKIKVMNGSSLNGYLKLDVNNLGIANINFSIISTSKTASIFSWKDTVASDYIIFDTYEITIPNRYPVSDESAQASNNYYKQMYYTRNKFDIYANLLLNKQIDLDASLELSGQSISLTIDMTRIDVPISPYFDIKLKSGYSIDLYSKMALYPGSSFITEKGTTLNFKYRGSVNFPEAGKSALGKELIIPSETRYIAGGMIAYSKNLNFYNGYTPVGFNKGIYAQGEYWNIIKPSNHIIEGNITFDDSITDRYYISGPIDISNEGIASIKKYASISKLKTYDTKAELVNGFWFNADNASVSKTNEFAAIFNTVPLISNYKAYIYDGVLAYDGVFDVDTGIFTKDSDLKKYFLKVDTDLYRDGSAGSNQSSPIDRDISIQEISTVLNNKIIKDKNNEYYAFYGGIFVPVLDTVDDSTTYTTIRINGRKFCSNKDSDVTNAQYYDDITVVYSNKKWKYSKFTNKA